MKLRFLLAALLGMLVVASCLLVVYYNRSSREYNERQASAVLKTVTMAEADFRSNDRDGNLVNDFWTADAYGLYGMIPIVGGQTRVPPDAAAEHPWAIRLLERDVAHADAQSRTGLYGNARPGQGGASNGYVIRAFAQQDDGSGSPTTLLNDTDGEAFYAEAHDGSRFAFLAFPLDRRLGRLAFMVNADNTIWKHELTEQYYAEFTPLGPGAESTSRVRGMNSVPRWPAVDDAAVFPSSPGYIQTHD